mgnify:CR=1 FL=1
MHIYKRKYHNSNYYQIKFQKFGKCQKFYVNRIFILFIRKTYQILKKSYPNFCDHKIYTSFEESNKLNKYSTWKYLIFLVTILTHLRSITIKTQWTKVLTILIKSFLGHRTSKAIWSIIYCLNFNRGIRFTLKLFLPLTLLWISCLSNIKKFN